VTKLLLSIHVLAAIIAIGPVTVAASMFPAATRRALTDPTDQRGLAVLRNLHRICRVYAALGVLVPVFGLATATSLDVLGDTWLITSIVLTVTAAAVLAFLVLPRQAAILTTLDAADLPGLPLASAFETAPSQPTGAHPALATTTTDSDAPGPQLRSATHRSAARLGMVTGIFNLLWAVVVVLMIVRPGSTTGA
jgi:uncharacterized membrane protein